MPLSQIQIPIYLLSQQKKRQESASFFVIEMSSMDASTLRHFVIHENHLATARIVGGSQKHTVAVDTRDASGGQVGNDNDLLADEFIRV